MKLTTLQIEQLFTFTQKHYVDYYDVQIEIVDHLANGIEAQWKNAPNRSFEEALQIEFKKFGVFGFSTLVEAKAKALNRQYILTLWRYFKAFLNFPKAVLLITLVWVYFEMLLMAMQLHVNWILIPTFLTLVGLPWVVFFKSHSRIRRSQKKTGKKWLFNSTLQQLGGIVHFMNVGMYLPIFYSMPSALTNFTSILLSVFVVTLGFVIYTAIFVVTPIFKQTFETQYSKK